MAKKMSLPAQMGIGMALGVIVGAMAPSMGFEAAWFKPLGDLFITLVRMVVVPLVFCTLIAGAAAVCDVKKLGRVATKTLVYYFATTTVAVALIAGVDRIMDMARTSINVLGDATGALVVSKWEGPDQQEC